MKIKKKLNINFYLFKLLNDQKKKLSVAAIKYIAFQANSFIFFVAFSCVYFLQLRKAPTFFYIEFFTYKHKPPINPLTIQSTISINFVVLIANEFSHSYNLFWTLKLRFVSTNQNKKIQIKTKYHELCKKSKNQNLNKWLNVWRKTYIIDKTLNVYEMIKKRSIKNFIYNIMNKIKIWTNAHLIFIDEKIKNDNLFNLIAKFKNHI